MKWDEIDIELKKIDKLNDSVYNKHAETQNYLSLRLASSKIGNNTLLVIEKGTDYPKTIVLNKEQALFLRDYLIDLFR